MKAISDNKNYKLLLFGENILYLAYFDDAEIDLEKIQEINQNGLQLVNYLPFYSVVNMRNIFGKMDNEAKAFIAENEELNNLKKIEILLINSLPIRILVNCYQKINKPKTETIIVKSIKELLNTLENIIPKNEGISELEKYLNTISNIT